MKNTKRSDSGKYALRLDGELTIYRAAELKLLLIDALQNTNELEIDLSGVTELDTAGTQILMLAKRMAQSMQRELRITGHSAVVLEVLELFNLVPYFGDAVVIQSQPAGAANRAA